MDTYSINEDIFKRLDYLEHWRNALRKDLDYVAIKLDRINKRLDLSEKDIAEIAKLSNKIAEIVNQLAGWKLSVCEKELNQIGEENKVKSRIDSLEQVVGNTLKMINGLMDWKNSKNNELNELLKDKLNSKYKLRCFTYGRYKDENR